jgi:hypothetical protein
MIIRMFSAAGYLNQQSEAYQLGCFGCLPLNCKNSHWQTAYTLVKVRPARQCEGETMIDLARLLPKLLKATGTNPEMAEIAARIAWTRAAGNGLRPHAVPFRLFRKTLIVAVADPIWQKQLQMMAAELVFRINQLLDGPVVDFIEFRIDPATVAKARARTWPDKASSSEGRTPIPADVLSAAGNIADPDLRQRFVRAAENCINRREGKQH